MAEGSASFSWLHTTHLVSVCVKKPMAGGWLAKSGGLVSMQCLILSDLWKQCDGGVGLKALYLKGVENSWLWDTLKLFLCVS